MGRTPNSKKYSVGGKPAAPVALSKEDPMPECPEQWRVDVNTKYQHAVGVITSLATGGMLIPIFFLKDVTGTPAGTNIADLFNWQVYVGLSLLSVSVLSAIGYHFGSAKWTK